MAVFTTSQGREVAHFHIGDPDFYDRDLNPAEISHARQVVADFLSAVEVTAPTVKFNCHGFAYTESHGWFNRTKPFNEDDVTQIPLAEAREGDIVSYMKSNRIKHSGIVEQVNEGKILKVRSKWGGMGTIIHDLNDVHPAYGTAQIARRRNA